MEIFLGQDIFFWTGFIAGLFILLHIPACDLHWAEKLGPFSKFLMKHQKSTLRIAAVFALAHVILSIYGLVSGIWV